MNIISSRQNIRGADDVPSDRNLLITHIQIRFKRTKQTDRTDIVELENPQIKE